MEHRMRDGVRQPVVADRFYAADAARCRADADRLTAAPVKRPQDAGRVIGGIAPHAGWICSGRVAGLTWRGLAEYSDARTVFLTGSVHTVELNQPALDTAEAWGIPGDAIAVDDDLRRAIAGLDEFAIFDRAHTHEHALEVQLPLMQAAMGEDVTFVPCMIPPSESAVSWGEALGHLLRDWPEPVALVASVDLTHHGPAYGFTPHGDGEAGYHWAHRENDADLLEHVRALDAAGTFDHACQQQSSCGPGALAAVLAAARVLGARRGHVLEHTDSVRELMPLGHTDTTNSVGYTAAVLGD